MRAERKVTDDRVQQVIDLKRKARCCSPAHTPRWSAFTVSTRLGSP